MWIDSKIVGSLYDGEHCTLNQIPFTYKKWNIDGTGLHFERIQFPIQLAYQDDQ